MSKKYVHIDVSTLVSTDFYLEVDENASDEEIIAMAKKEITLPHLYPYYLDGYLQNTFNLKVQGIDSMLRSWISDKLNYLIDGRNITTAERKQLDA